MTTKFKSLKVIVLVMAMIMIFGVLSTSVSAATTTNQTYPYPFGICFSDFHANEVKKLLLTTEDANKYATADHEVTLISGKNYELFSRSRTTLKLAADYSTDNMEVGRVYYGYFRASTPGVVNLSAKYKDKESTVKINVVDKIGLASDQINLTKGQMAHLDLGLKSDDKYLYSVDWVSNDENVAYVSGDLVYAHNVGTAKIEGILYWREMNGIKEVKTEICKLEATVTVYPELNDIGFNDANLELYIGENHQLVYTIDPANSGLPVVFTSDNPEIVTVDENGKVTAIKEGYTYVNVYSGYYDNNVFHIDTYPSGYIWVRVNEPVKPVFKSTIASNIASFVSVDKTECEVGETVTVSITSTQVAYDNYVEHYGMSSIYAIDSNGMMVKLTKEADDKYSFVMPEYDVTIDGVFSLQYKTSCSVTPFINVNRDNNVIGTLTITEYAPNSAFGTIDVNFGFLKISDVVAESGSYTINEDGSVTITIDSNRTSASLLNFIFYADRQDANQFMKYKMNVSGISTLSSVDSISVAKETLPMSTTYVSANDINGSIVTARADEMLIIDSDVLDQIRSQNVSILLDFGHYSVTIPATSLTSLRLDSGSYVAISSDSSAVTMSENGEYRTGGITAVAYNADGASRDVTDLLGRCTFSTSYTPNYNLQLCVNDVLYDFDAEANSGKYTIAVSSLSSLKTFSLYANIIDNKLDDVIYIVVIVLLIAALIVAMMFLVKRILINKENKYNAPDSPASDADENTSSDNENVDSENKNIIEENPETDDTNEESLSDDEAFKTVNEVLEEVNNVDSEVNKPSDNE